MRTIIYFLCFSIIVFVAEYTLANQSMIQVASQGDTVIRTTVGELNLKVTIKTHEVQIDRFSNGRPADINSSCTFSKYPCSIVDRIEIVVNDNPLFIRRAVFCDLADLNKAGVRRAKNGAILILEGGDASESYIVRIEFDAVRVKKRTLSSGMLPDLPSQETIFYRRVIGD